MIYKPKAHRKGFRIPFGYMVNPLDPYILIPDIKKLDALHYAFRMKAKYNTSLRDCVMWLHVATQTKVTPHGFQYMYKAWLKRLKNEKLKEIQVRRDSNFRFAQKCIDKNFQELSIEINDRPDIACLADIEIKKEAIKA